MRGFEVVSKFEGQQINIPVRKTALSAGYDIESADYITLRVGEVTIIPTGLKAFMNDDEYLGIHIRSGTSIKNTLMMINSQGIIDADYYNNADNEGHIGVPVFNAGNFDYHVKKGDRIAQGIFYKYLTTTNDNATGERTGGMGSTGK